MVDNKIDCSKCIWGYTKGSSITMCDVCENGSEFKNKRGDNRIKSEIKALLDQNGSMTIRDIKNELGYNEDFIDYALEELIRDGECSMEISSHRLNSRCQIGMVDLFDGG